MRQSPLVLFKEGGGDKCPSQCQKFFWTIILKWNLGHSCEPIIEEIIKFSVTSCAFATCASVRIKNKSTVGAL